MKIEDFAKILQEAKDSCKSTEEEEIDAIKKEMAKYNLSDDQKELIDLIRAGKNIFITGKAGTGKSFITKMLKGILPGKTIVMLGMTGVAANNIGGQTVHSFFRIPIHGMITKTNSPKANKWDCEKFNEVDVIVIDEASMLRPDQLDGIKYMLSKSNCKPLDEMQMILVGDMKQLPPIYDSYMKDGLEEEYGVCDPTFKDSHTYENFVEFELTTIHRQTDVEFINNLNLVRDGKKAPYFNRFIGEKNNGVILAPMNYIVNMYNSDGLNALKGEEYEFEAKIKGEYVKPEDFNVQKLIKMKDGAKIMFLLNKGGLVNGSLGTFRAIKKVNPYNKAETTSFFFEDENGFKTPLEREKFEKHRYKMVDGKMKCVLDGSILQLPIRLAYALTIHKSQGLTFDEVTIDISRKCFAKGQFYTALSRVRTPEGLKIIM